MCIIISKPEGVSLEEGVYEECFKFNKDGAGFACVRDNELIIDKGYFDFNQLYAAIRAEEAGHMVVHFRIATHGEIGEDNCHPFLIKSHHAHEISFAVAHNGILNWRSTKADSDTSCFIKDFLAPVLSRDPWFLEHPQGKLMLEKVIGTNNKLSILRHNNKTQKTDRFIINDIAGTYDLGCWFSNWTYKRYIPPTTHLSRREQDMIDAEMYGYTNVNGVWVRNTPANADIIRPDWPAVKQGSIAMLRCHSVIKPTTPSGDKDRAIVESAPTVKLEGGVNIKVPRTNDMRINLHHLTKSERKRLRSIACEYVKSRGVNPKDSSLYEMITWIREDVRAIHDGFKHVPEETIDKWILMERDKHATQQTFIDEMENI